MKNALYFGDNLKVMREMQTARYHLCYFDLPFNSGSNYNIFIAGSKAQRKAFDDIWRWDDAARENQDAVLHYDGRHPVLVETMDKLTHCLARIQNSRNRQRRFRVTQRDIRALYNLHRTHCDLQKTAIGIFITLHPVTRGMRNLADVEKFQIR